jgi:hypothetical protein
LSCLEQNNHIKRVPKYLIPHLQRWVFVEL